MNQNIPLPPDNYKPNENEPYMNPIMLAYFEKKLFDWKERLLQESSDIQRAIEESTERMPDFVDEGVVEVTRKTEYYIAKQDLSLMEQIDYAIERINNGSYGYCEKTGKEIGINRLDAWPIASLTVQAQTEKENLKA